MVAEEREETTIVWLRRRSVHKRTGDLCVQSASATQKKRASLLSPVDAYTLMYSYLTPSS